MSLKLVIETCENYREIFLFPWLQKSDNKAILKYDLLPIKYEDKQYFISLAFPYKYNYIHLEYNDDIFKVNLIHCSNELNLAIYECNKYEGKFYSINDLKYRIPLDKFDDFVFKTNESMIPIKHIDYCFKNFDSELLPPLAYLSVQSDPVYIGSILYNMSNDSIYGILQTTYDTHIVIPSIAIKRLLDGTKTDFKYSNFYCDYGLNNNIITSGVSVIKSQYTELKEKDIITDIDNLMILNGKIKYSKINEWVPIEVYMWYEWLPNTTKTIKILKKKGKSIEKNLQFINYSSMINIPIREETSDDGKIVKLTFELLNYFYERKVILNNKKITESLLNPYNKSKLSICLDDSIICTKYETPTSIESFEVVSN